MHLRYKTITHQKGTGNYYFKDEILVTEEDAWTYDWIFELFKHFGYSKTAFEKRKKEYIKKHAKTISNRDIFWSIFNELLNKFMKESALQNMGIVYHLMAKFLKEEGKDPYIQLQQEGRMRLLKLKNGNCKKIRIGLSKRKSDPVPCQICISLENKLYDIEKVLKELPLPPKECRNKYCYTYYKQVFEWSLEDRR